MRTRHILSAVVYGVGALTGLVGLFLAQAGTDFVKASSLIIGAIALMGAGVIFLMAIDDPQSRSQMLPKDSHIDLRHDEPAKAQPRQPVHA